MDSYSGGLILFMAMYIEMTVTIVESVLTMERLLFRIYFVKYYSDHADMTIILLYSFSLIQME